MYDYSEYESFWNNPISDYHRLLEPYLKEVLAKYLQSDILEIGFGSGHLPVILQKAGFSGNYLGIDTDQGAIDFAKIQTPENCFAFEKFTEYNTLESRSYDLAIFCLSSCEMSDAIILDYLRSMNVKEVLIINPSTTTNYFDSRIIKPSLNKVFSRLGAKPKWQLIGNIPHLGEVKRNYFINRNNAVQASMYYRSLGDLLNICKEAGYDFRRFEDLKYTENTVKTAPVSKFEVLWLDKN